MEFPPDLHGPSAVRNYDALMAAAARVVASKIALLESSIGAPPGPADVKRLEAEAMEEIRRALERGA